MMKHTKLVCALACATIACFTGGTAFATEAKKVGAEVVAPEYVNYIVNGDFENGTAAPFFAGGIASGSLSVSTDIKYEGNYAVKFSGRTTASSLNYASYDVEIGKTYVFSAQIYSEIPMWFNVQATAWAHHDGGSLWNTAGNTSVLTEAGVWAPITSEFRLYYVGSQLYIQANGAEGVLVQDWNSGHTATRNLHHVDFEINALDTLDTMYVDNVVLYEKDFPYGERNLAANGGMEDTNFSMYGTLGNGTVSKSVAGEPAWKGNSSAKFNFNAPGDYFFQTITGLEIGKPYTFSVMAYSTVATWANLVVSPWSVNTTGNMMWNDAVSPGILLEGNTWTKMYVTIILELDESNQLWINMNGNKSQAVNHGDLNDSKTFVSLANVQFKYHSGLAVPTTIYFDDFKVYDATAENVGKVTNMSISAAEDFALNYYVQMKKGTKSVKANVAMEGKEAEVVVGEYDAAKDLWRFTYPVAAKEYDKNVTLQVVEADGVDVNGATATYSVKAYTETVKNGQYDAALKALVTELAEYGEAAKAYFAGTASDKIAEDTVTAADLAAYKGTVSGAQEGVELLGATLILESKTTICVYFKAASVEGIECTGTPVCVDAENGIWVIEKSVVASELSTAQTFNIGGITVTYSAFSYLEAALVAGNAQAGLYNVLQEIYDYALAAKAYLG